MSENGTQQTTEASPEEVDELRAHNAQLEAMVEALQGRELELSRELISYYRAELEQLREAVREG